MGGWVGVGCLFFGFAGGAIQYRWEDEGLYPSDNTDTKGFFILT